jgi:hypothetical protein
MERPTVHENVKLTTFPTTINNLQKPIFQSETSKKKPRKISRESAQAEKTKLIIKFKEKKEKGK